jgi:RNA polymerase sigma-70 factor (ECF subfamily)
MTEADFLAQRFEQSRPHLAAVAYRMLGSTAEADDAVQETWLRLSRSDPAAIDNLTGWLTTVVGRICLDMLRARTTRREAPLDQTPEPADDLGPEQDAVLADTVGAALLVVLDTLTPNERLAFVLHDLFGVAFAEIAAMIDATPEAARQYASRARRRLRGSDASGRPDPPRQRRVVEAFLAASRGGDFDALLRLLAPDVVVTGDAAAVAIGADAELRGRRQVAEAYSGRALAARLVLLDGLAGAAWSLRGEVKVAFVFTTDGDLVTGIHLVADPRRLEEISVERAV